MSANLLNLGNSNSSSSGGDSNRPRGERDPLLTNKPNSKKKKGNNRGLRGSILEAAQAKAAAEAEERKAFASYSAGETRGGGVIRARRSSKSPVQEQQQSSSLHFKQQQPQPQSFTSSMLRSSKSADTNNNNNTASSSLLQQQQQQQQQLQQQQHAGAAKQDHPDDDVLLVRTSASLPQHYSHAHPGYEAIHDEAVITTTHHHHHHHHRRGVTSPAQAAAVAAQQYAQTPRPFGRSLSAGNDNNNYHNHPNLEGTTNVTSGINPRMTTGGDSPPPSVVSSATGGSTTTDYYSSGGGNGNGGGDGGDQQHNNTHHHHNHRSSRSSANRSTTHHHHSQQQQQPAPILEIPEEIYVVRKAALQVLKPLTKTWVVISVGFALTVLFGTSRWTRLMPGLPFWFILLPCWVAHCGLLWLHVLSAQALSHFIADANESRQRPDSRDHLNRTEYLPLLQRSLKFGLKTGLLSFVMFLFEILIYVRMAKGTISLSAAFIPLWLLVLGGIIDGLICKTQHFLRVICWVLAFTAMFLTCLKVDYHVDAIRWRIVISPVVAFLSVASGTLIYIVYGHQVGYYRLTESQLTAGNLYSLAALICMVLMIMIGEVIPLSRPVEIETRLFVVILAPLVVCLVGMGAWVVSRDEFGRLLLYGGQSAVHPMKLRWEAKGWTSVQGKGVTVIPMFGEVAFQPLERPFEPQPKPRVVEMCLCCSGSCYPYEEEDEETVHLTDDLASHPYLDPGHSSRPYIAMRGSV